ncbi:MAG: plasmid stabilization protein [Hydrogenophilales bacterium 16-64-46]|nr:MAG: plasmid stabilization protein [Hydrogenophilales bacterium 12-64-13]OYZ06246.1 MAG: plasmid stabilization protein [Hydrogenophilales bacterium 16-64-46]OZA38855.1 MAG: plasmid stabilization protein [Hydrogenophilales bacterium 17-64-34]HQS99505.1 type II toxin-antitoxin system RelE/ParE family toxin [Thiobacillus sp.]
MSVKPVVPRRIATRDTETVIDWYRSQNAPDAARLFLDALERAIAQLARHPAAGSSRFDHELGLPGLRVWPLKRFPYMVFYVERPDHIDVWRILHAQRDLPAWLCEDPPAP